MRTAGPWKLLPEEVGRDYIRIRGTRLGGRYKIANVLSPSFGGMPEREIEETRANARHIVKSANLHDELVDALKAIEQRANESGTGEMAERETIYAIYGIARAILAKVEEEL